MTEESRNQKLLREVNEEIAREKDVFMGMTGAQRKLLVIVVLVAALFALLVGYAMAAPGGSFPITITCPKDLTNNTCSLSRDEAAKVFTLIEHNNAVTRALTEARKCGAINET